MYPFPATFSIEPSSIFFLKKEFSIKIDPGKTRFDFIINYTVLTFFAKLQYLQCL
jgi:hypothetical protein